MPNAYNKVWQVEGVMLQAGEVKQRDYKTRREEEKDKPAARTNSEEVLGPGRGVT